MPPLPVLRADRVVTVFASMGWEVLRQRGSHIILAKDGEMATLSVPNHNPVARGTLRGLIRTANLSVSEFLDALDRL